MKPFRAKYHEQGLTLVELMIGVALSIMLLGGAISIFMGNKQTFRLQEDLARVQENIRYAVTRMITDISPAGYLGCAPSTQGGNLTVENTVTGGSSLYNFAEVVSGVEGGGANGSDQLTVRYTLPESGMPVTAAMVAGYEPVQVDTNYPGYADLETGSIIAVGDCKVLATFMITNDPASSGGSLAHTMGPTNSDGASNSVAGTSHIFGDARYASAMVYKMSAITYELDTTINNGKTISSLYATRLGGNRQQLLAGVEDFQVQYGIDGIDINTTLDGMADRFIDWDTVVAQNREDLVSSLRISMTVNPGEPVPGADGLDPNFTKTVEFTVKLRNRLADL